MTKIITYNLNGIRAAISKNWIGWLEDVAPDLVCLQEIKANPDQFDLTPLQNLGYHCYWYPAQKKGYSGTAILSKTKPINVQYGCGHEFYDFEGRCIRADFEKFSLMSVYFPSGTTGDIRQKVKMEFLSNFQEYINELKKSIPNLIICGDINICHKAIDIHDPIGNKKSSGFLPEEREWLDQFMQSGFIDSFRYFNQEPHQYTWWSQRAGSRGKNKGWRIDYNLVSETLESKLKRSVILPQAVHSDHCPVLTELEF